MQTYTDIIISYAALVLEYSEIRFMYSLLSYL